MKLIFKNKPLIILSVFFISCCFYVKKFPDYERIANKITERTAKELQEQKNLLLVGTGGGMMNDIQMMAMSFFFYQVLDLKTARELIVFSTEKYLENINNSKEIRPYLHEYPFTAKNIEVRIFIYKLDGSSLSPEKIHCISSINGMLDYYIQDKGPYHPLHEETYEEALQEIAFHDHRK